MYKPTQGELSEDEYAILEELNKMVLAGEVKLERLQSIGAARRLEAGTITAMEQAFEDFTPQASGWFSSTQEYVGRCVARFSAPRGTVEGQARVKVDDKGKVQVEMDPERDSLQTEEPFTLGLMRFFGGKDMMQDLGNGIQRMNPEARNPCEGLKIETPKGTFETNDVLYYGTDAVLDTGDVTSATFAVGDSVFEAKDAEEPHYWVLPLTNFLSECRQWRPELNRHPLRVFPTPEVPDEIRYVAYGPDQKRDEIRAMTALITANSKNKLIVFGFRGGQGFVERLPDYEESERLLLEGKENLKTTAVMVGPIGGESVETLERMQKWFPFDVISLLTLATGTEVGRPWVEIRDAKGQVVRRFHHPFGVKPYRNGRRLIREIPMTRSRGHRAIGRLIECADSRSREFGKTFLRVAIGHLVRAGYEHQTLDDSMTHLARGFETLCKRYGMTTQVLSTNLGLPLRQDVGNALADCAQQIRSLRTKAATGERAALDQIANRVLGAEQKDKPFGIAVAQLLKAFWLPDAQILEDHYRNRPLGWGAILSHYRGDVIHHGYLDILEGGHDWKELASVRSHLCDALARVILSILMFDGGYHPWVVPYLGSFPVNWVKPQYRAAALGY